MNCTSKGDIEKNDGVSNDAVTSVSALKRFKCPSAKLESATSAAHTLVWHAAVPAEQVHAADKRTAAACRCCGFLARAQSHVQLSGRHCIGFRCGTSVTGLRWTGFFSVCGMLTQGRRNRMSKSLEMRVRLKLNVKLIGWLGWQTFYPLYSDFEYIRHSVLVVLFFHLCVDCIFDLASLNYMTDHFAASFHWIIFPL